MLELSEFRKWHMVEKQISRSKGVNNQRILQNKIDKRAHEKR